MYKTEEKLNLEKKVYLTKEVYNLLRDEKRRLAKIGTKMSMAKIACNIIIEKYESKK